MLSLRNLSAKILIEGLLFGGLFEHETNIDVDQNVLVVYACDPKFALMQIRPRLLRHLTIWPDSREPMYRGGEFGISPL